MAFKTIIRQLISKWGILSIEMQDAFTKDMAVLYENGDYEYVDNPNIENRTTIDVELKEEQPKKTTLDEI